MNRVATTCIALIAGLALVGCAKTEITRAEREVDGAPLARPDRIIVREFAATPLDVSAESTMAGRYDAHLRPQSVEDIEAGRLLGERVAEELIARMVAMGLPAVAADDQLAPDLGDVIVLGEFVSINEGAETKRVTIGFGYGATRLVTVVEAYVMSDTGLRRIGSRQIEDGGAKRPGLVLPVSVLAKTGSPFGLIVSGGANVVSEATGRSAIDGAAKRTAKTIAEEARHVFERYGWL